LGQPSGLESLVLASTCASVPAFATETRRLKESLPAEVQTGQLLSDPGALLPRRRISPSSKDPPALSLAACRDDPSAARSQPILAVAPSQNI